MPFSFPTDNSTASINARFNAAAVTLQNLNGAGVGCPISSTTWVAQQAAIDNAASGQADIAEPATKAAATPVSPRAAAASPSITSAGGLSIAQINALAPQLGFQAGVNPTGTGDCDGAVDGANGQPIKVPCTCPPSRDAFIQVWQWHLNEYGSNRPDLTFSRRSRQTLPPAMRFTTRLSHSHSRRTTPRHRRLLASRHPSSPFRTLTARV